MSNNSGKNNDLSSLLKTMGGDDCDRPACDDTKSALTAALQRVQDGTSMKQKNHPPKSKSVRQSSDVPQNYTACPPTRDEIGVSTWSLLHTMVRHICPVGWHDTLHFDKYIPAQFSMLTHLNSSLFNTGSMVSKSTIIRG